MVAVDHKPRELDKELNKFIKHAAPASTALRPRAGRLRHHEAKPMRSPEGLPPLP